MPSESIDALQKALASQVFHNRADVKKAAGRALGTIVELMTFYLLKQWNLLPSLTIELRVVEFGNPEITHNVEFALHPATIAPRIVTIENDGRPIKARQLLSLAECEHDQSTLTSAQLLGTDGTKRNCFICARNSSGELWVANFIGSELRGHHRIELGLLKPTPYAIVECKRVGKEEGQKKGPTTIEKAKQGAYVAKHVSRLQKVRGMDGRLYGALPRSNGSFEFRPFEEELSRLVYSAPPEELDGFVLTVGVVSNHGNWFTSNNPNKELRVLKQSYDWLLFLNDPAIVAFVRDTILSENPAFKSVAAAFQRSYTNRKKGDKNCFTKVLIDHAADAALEGYFSRNISTIETQWFSVLSPADRELPELNRELHFLGQKLSRNRP